MGLAPLSGATGDLICLLVPSDFFPSDTLSWPFMRPMRDRATVPVTGSVPDLTRGPNGHPSPSQLGLIEVRVDLRQDGVRRTACRPFQAR